MSEINKHTHLPRVTCKRASVCFHPFLSLQPSDRQTGYQIQSCILHSETGNCNCRQREKTVDVIQLLAMIEAKQCG
ncbi:MAG: hypothetical protein CR997_01340 [Acidobacteria bacterium]|nr:MAG: hypothetical protein CR997_01340 [Acidobacteriota bacterium]